MPELRKDPIVDRWVIASPEHHQRPSDFHLQPEIHPPKVCPFCPGHEEMTPNEVLAYRRCPTMPNTPGWTVRVVPNKYPAVPREGALLIALPMIPRSFREQLEGGGRYYHARGLCIFCDTIQQEAQVACRVILETAAFIALAPFASRFPFEAWLLPKGHEASFERACGEAYRQLAVALQAVLRRLFRALGDPPTILRCIAPHGAARTNPTTTGISRSCPAWLVWRGSNGGRAFISTPSVPRRQRAPCAEFRERGAIDALASRCYNEGSG